MFKILSLVLFSPFFVGFIAILFKRKTSVSTLLLHHIYKDKCIPHSLSEISEEKFNFICQKLKIADRKIKRIKDRTENTDEVSITFDDGFASNMTAADILTRNNLTGTFFVTTAHLSGEKSIDVYSSDRRLSENEIADLHSKGFEIGSHTVHHLDLTLLSDEDLRRELSDSKATLERIIKEPIVSVSVPYGLWNNRVIAVAKEVGYESIVVYNYTKKANISERVFPSYGVYPFDMPDDVLRKLNGTSRLLSARTELIPHFAKGSPLAAFHSLYRRFPLPWFTNRKENKESNKK